MAAGDTDILICSRALTLLGEAPISSFNEGTDAANTCDRLYTMHRNALLRMYPWSFATAKTQLAQSATAPKNEWTYKYQLPGEILGTPRAVFNSSAVGAQPLTDGWEIYDGYVYTDETTIYVDYWYEPGESKYPDYFVQLLVYALAGHLAMPITEQQSLASLWMGVAFGNPGENMRGGYFRQACQADGQGQRNQALQDFPLVAARY